MNNLPGVKTSKAQFSECGLFRYSLEKVFDADYPKLVWIMANPSKATEYQDDPTVRKCQRLALKWGYGGVVIVNLYAYRSTDPKILIRLAKDGVNVGADLANVFAITAAIRNNRNIMVAWGSLLGELAEPPSKMVEAIAKEHRRHLMALDINRDGNPKHPLYASLSSTPVAWRDYRAND